jgi:hypothetical protein
MKGFIVLVVSSIAGGLGWWLGAFEGVMTAFFVSIIFTAVSIFYCKRLMDEYLP